MAKTIEEMAEIYMNKNRLSMYDEDTGEVELIASLDIKRAYQYGADAILEEIERVAVIDKGDDRPWMMRGNHLYNVLMDKIKQLKGE